MQPLHDFPWRPMVGAGVSSPSPMELSKARRCYGTAVLPLIRKALASLGADVSHDMPRKVYPRPGEKSSDIHNAETGSYVGERVYRFHRMAFCV